MNDILQKSDVKLRTQNQTQLDSASESSSSVFVSHAVQQVMRVGQGPHKVFVQEVSGVFQPGIFSFSYERKSEEKMKTAGQIEG